MFASPLPRTPAVHCSCCSVVIVDAVVIPGTLVYCVRDDGTVPLHGRVIDASANGIDAEVTVQAEDGQVHRCAASSLYAHPWRWFESASLDP